MLRLCYSASTSLRPWARARPDLGGFVDLSSLRWNLGKPCQALRAFRRCLHTILCDERVLDIVGASEISGGETTIGWKIPVPNHQLMEHVIANYKKLGQAYVRTSTVAFFCDSGWTQVEHQMTLHFSRLGKPCSAMEGWVGVCSDVDHALARGDCAEKEPREHLCESSNPRCTWKFHTKPGSDLIVENVAKTKIESVYQSVIHVMINFNLYGRHRMFQRMALPIKKPWYTDHWPLRMGFSHYGGTI